jgi:hypothetical protein
MKNRAGWMGLAAVLLCSTVKAEIPSEEIILESTAPIPSSAIFRPSTRINSPQLTREALEFEAGSTANINQDTERFLMGTPEPKAAPTALKEKKKTK